VRVEIKVYDAPVDHFTAAFAGLLEACLGVAVQQCVDYRTKKPRSRSTTGLITGHKGTLITLEISRAKVVIVKPALTGEK